MFIFKVFLFSCYVALTTTPAETFALLGDPVLRISDVQENIRSTGLSKRTCLVIDREWNFHLERSTQQLPGYVKHSQVKSTLTPTEAIQLQHILGSKAIAELPVYVPPKMPLAISTVELFWIKVGLSGSTHEAGFLAWTQKDNAGSPNDSPAQLKQEWQKSEDALMPLRQWMLQVEDARKPSTGDADRVESCDGPVQQFN